MAESFERVGVPIQRDFCVSPSRGQAGDWLSEVFAANPTSAADRIASSQNCAEYTGKEGACRLHIRIPQFLYPDQELRPRSQEVKATNNSHAHPPARFWQ